MQPSETNAPRSTSGVTGPPVFIHGDLARENRPEPLPPLNELSIIQHALDKGITGEQLTLFTNSIAKIEERKAARVFADAITAFQRDCPQIEKIKEGGKTNDSDRAAYHYAPYEHLMSVAGPHMSRNGIVPTFTFDDGPPGFIKVTCRIRVGIHQEPTTLTLPIPQGNRLVNASQLMGQALSYAKRYAISAALNIVTKDEDKDGADLLDTLIAEEVEEIESELEDRGDDNSKSLFLSYASKKAGRTIEAIENIPRSMYGVVMNGLKTTSPKPGSPAAKRAAEAKKGAK